MKMEECMVEIKDQEAKHLKVTIFAPDTYKCPGERGSTLNHSQIWIANDDNDVEGEWINWYTGEVGLIHNHTWSPCLMCDIENERYCVYAM